MQAQDGPKVPQQTQTVYRELHPPTAVTHCVEAYFTHPAPASKDGRAAAVPPNLVLARGTRLEVYALNYGPGPCLGSRSSSRAATASSSGNCRLELVGSYPCWGVVCGLAVLRGKGSSEQRDSIIVVVRDAKLSVIEWNAELHCLKNGSLHSYEKPELREGCTAASSIGGGGTLVSVPPLVATDPAGRCAAALLHGRLLAVLPAIQADVLELLVQQDKDGARSSSAVVGNSYTVNLAKVPSLRLTSSTAVRDMAFMHGFTEPLLVLLHETVPTWGARLKESRDACALSALSINVRKKRQPVIWHVPQLPSDCCSIMAVPRGGVLVLSQNLLMYHAQGGSCVMAINSNTFAGEVPPKLDPPSTPVLPQYIRGDADKLLQAASQAALEKAVTAATNHAKQWAANVHPETVPAAARGAPKAPGLELEADGAVGCWMEDNVALLSLKTGQLLLVSLRFEGTAASKMQVAVVGSAPVASCAARLTPNLLFFGSQVGDSLLIQATRERGTSTAAAAAAGGHGNPAEHPAKRRRLASLASFDMGGSEGSLHAASFSGAAAGGAAAASGGGVDFGDGFDVDGEWELYKSATGRSSSMKLPALTGATLKYSLQVLDSLLCLGPIRSTVVADLNLRESDVQASLSGLRDHRPSSSKCVIAAVGADKSGALAILRRGVVADVITAVPNLGAHGAWTLHYRPTAERAAAAAATAAATAAAAAAAATAAAAAAAEEDAGVVREETAPTAAAAAAAEGAGEVDGGSSSISRVKQEQVGVEQQGGGEDSVMQDVAAAAAADGKSAAEAADDKPPPEAAAAAAHAAGASEADAAGPKAAEAAPPPAAATAAAAAAAVAGGGDDVGSGQHAFLLLSCGGSHTMVLDARGAALNEVSHDVAYIRNAPTIAVGEMFDAAAAVQVTHHTVRLVVGTELLLQDFTLSHLLAQANHPAAAAVAAATAAAAAADGSSDAHSALALTAPVCIKFAQVRDPYVLLMLSDSTVLLLQGYYEQQQQRQQLRLLQEALPQLAEAGWAVPQGAATAACLYTDSSGWLAATVGLPVTTEGRDQQQQDGPAVAAEGGEDDVAMLVAEAAAEAPAAGDVEQLPPTAAAAAAAEAAVKDGVQGTTAAAGGGDQDVQMADAEAPDKKQHSAPGNADGPGSSPAAAAGAAADKVPATAAAPAAAKIIPGLHVPAPAAPAAVAADAGGLDDDADGMATGVEGPAAAAAAAVQTAAEAAAAAADSAAAADGATVKGRATAGVKVYDAAIEAAEADAGGDGAGHAQQQQQQQRMVAADSLMTPFQAAAAAGIEDAAVRMEAHTAAAVAGQAGQQQQQQQQQGVSSFVCVVRAGGGLQVFALPHMQCVFEDGEALLGHQVLSPSRPPSLYDEDVSDAELNPSPLSEVMMECFAHHSGGATGVAAAAAPLLVLLRDDGSILAYKAFRPLRGRLGFRQLPLGPTLLGHETPAPPPANTPAAAVSGIAGMPAPNAPPCRLVRFDRLATPRLNPPLGPGFKQPGLDPAGVSGQGLRDAAAATPATPGPQIHYSGVLVCGPKPLWLVASRGVFVAHPMDVKEGSIDAFCGFDNVNCPQGFIAAGLTGSMRVCTLPLQLRLDQPWLTSKLPLRSTPLALTVYPPKRPGQLNILALATSRLSAPPRPFLPAESGGDPVAAAAYATADAAARAAGVEELNEVLLLAPPGFGLRMNSYVSVAGALAAAAAMAAAGSSAGSNVAAAEGRLLPTPSLGAAAAASASSVAGSAARVAAAVAAAAGWAGLPMWRHSLMPGEEVTALSHVELLEEGNTKPEDALRYIAVGCGSAFGEDYPALGRLLLLEVHQQEVYHVNGTQTKITARLALQRELPGPVMAVESLRGFLILAVGHRLEMHYKQGNSLVKMGQFIDFPSIVSGISIVSGFMLVGTASHSAHFVRYRETTDKHTQEKTQGVSLLSSDSHRIESWAVNFCANNKKLLQVVADGGGNIHVMQYDKENPDSYDGQKLMRCGAAHIGSWLTSLSRMNLATHDGSKRQALLGASSQGGIILLSPFWDDNMFKRMTSLYEELVYRLQHTAGLNPKAFQGRYARAGPAYGAGFYPAEPLSPDRNELLQGDVLWAFMDMDQRAQAAVAMAVGCDVSLLIRDLHSLTVVADFL